LLFLKLFQMSPLSSKSERVGEQGCSIKHGMTLIYYWFWIIYTYISEYYFQISLCAYW